MKSSLAVLAIGGNSLIKDKNHIALSSQYEAIQETSKYIAELIAEGMRLVITHGNGPQVGFIYRKKEGHFKPGSMKPKIEAIIEFLEGGGPKAIIASPENLLKAVHGNSGKTYKLTSPKKGV